MDSKFVEIPCSGLEGEFEIFHSSKKRKCFIDGHFNEIIRSGDMVIVKDNQIYLKCRIDRLVKINGNMVDTDLIESVAA